jgi:hypothetical protein
MIELTLLLAGCQRALLMPVWRPAYDETVGNAAWTILLEYIITPLKQLGSHLFVSCALAEANSPQSMMQTAFSIMLLKMTMQDPSKGGLEEDILVYKRNSSQSS